MRSAFLDLQWIAKTLLSNPEMELEVALPEGMREEEMTKKDWRYLDNIVFRCPICKLWTPFEDGIHGEDNVVVCSDHDKDE